MWKRLLEALDRNTAWRVFRHVKTAGDVFAYFGGWIWVATGVGAVLSYITSSPWHIKLILGLLSIVLVLGGALLRKLLRAAPASEDESVSPVSGSKARGIMSAVGMTVVIALAIVISSKLQPTKPPGPTPIPSPAHQICSPVVNAAAPTDFQENATKAQRNAYRHKLIRAWRAMISEVASACPVEAGYSEEQVSAAIQRHPDFQSLRPYLSQEAKRQLAKTTTGFYGAKIQNVLVTLQNDVDRIEGEWKLSPSPNSKPSVQGPPSLPKETKTKTPGDATATGTNSGSIGAVTQGPCSNLQVGGSNNQATTNCAPIPFRTLTEPQKRGIKAFVSLLPATVLVTIGSIIGSGDGDTYALEFFPLFDGHHLDNETIPRLRTGFPATYTDVFVATVSDSDTASQYRDGLVDTLISLGIPAHKANGSKISPGNFELLIGFRPEEVTPR